MATTGGRIIFEPHLRPPVETPPTKSSTTKTTDRLITTNMVFSTATSLSSALPKTPIINSKIIRTGIKTNTSNLGNTLRNFGDNVNTTNTISNLGSALRNSGDRFLQNQ